MGRGFFSLYLLIPKKEWGIYLFLDLGGTDRLPQVQVVMFASIIPAPQALSLQNAYFSITTQQAPGDVPEARSGTQTHLSKGIVIQTLRRAFVLCKISSCGGYIHLSKSSQGWFGFNHIIMRNSGLHQSFSVCSADVLQAVISESHFRLQHFYDPSHFRLCKACLLALLSWTTLKSTFKVA